MSDKILELSHLAKKFGENEVLKDINLTVNRGEVISIIGSSGSGKSTMLRCINLLEEPTDGKIYFKAARRIAPGSFVNVKIREVLDYDLMGRAILNET